MPEGTRAWFPALTGLRFLLALWVVLDHLAGKGLMLEKWSQSTGPATQRLTHSGYLAVQTFFILSGFVLAQSYASTTWNRNTLRRFGMARFARIYPVYVLSLIVVSRFMVETLSRPGRTPAEKLALLGDYGFILLGWMGPLAVGWNTPAWTLSCEIFFYLCFPLLILYLGNAKASRILTALAICFVLPLLLASAGVPSIWKPIYHLADFVAGIAAAELYRMMAGSWLVMRRRGYWLYLPALAAGAWLITRPWILRGTVVDLNTALRPLNILLLIGLAAGGGFLARVLSTRAAETLGKASYAMYILHVPMLWWFSRYAFNAPLIYVACVVAISILAFEFVEKPANRWLRSRAHPHADVYGELKQTGLWACSNALRIPAASKPAAMSPRHPRRNESNYIVQ